MRGNLPHRPSEQGRLEPSSIRDGRARIATDSGATRRAAATQGDGPPLLGLMSSGTRSVDDGLSLRLQGGPEAAARARRAISGLRADIDPPLMETLRLLITELVTNSVKHAGAETVVVKVLVGRSAVLTEVTDEGPGFDPTDTGRPRQDSTGWGLFLVERLAHRWGVRQEGDATRVWFELVRA
jgi:anti-sigma regulatory factor (Ser/Thr protein kinase)